jgi:hypothetical protein
LEVAPDKSVAGMSLRHGSHNNDGCNATTQDQEQANVLQLWDQSIEEDDECRAEPQDEDESNIRVPWLNDEARMIYGVHLRQDVCWDGDN